jgi:hypothetical protein
MAKVYGKIIAEQPAGRAPCWGRQSRARGRRSRWRAAGRAAMSGATGLVGASMLPIGGKFKHMIVLHSDDTKKSVDSSR